MSEHSWLFDHNAVNHPGLRTEKPTPVSTRDSEDTPSVVQSQWFKRHKEDIQNRIELLERDGAGNPAAVLGGIMVLRKILDDLQAQERRVRSRQHVGSGTGRGRRNR